MIKRYPYWWEDAGAPKSEGPQALPGRADAVVIGAGHTGSSAARTLAKRGLSVVVLEKEQPGYGASSRNGGMIGGGHRLSVGQLEERFGRDIGHRMAREAHIDALAFTVDELIEGEGIECDFRRTGRFRGLWEATEYEKAARELERLQKVVEIDAWMVPRSEQRKEVSTDVYDGGTIFNAHGALNPAKYTFGIMAAARRAGASFHGETPVTRVERVGKGFRITTPRGTIETPLVLAATNGYTDRALQPERRRIIPVPSYIVATEPLGENRVKSLFPTGRMVAETRERHCYFRPSPDGKRVVFGTRAAMCEAPDGFVQSELRKLMTEIFPDLNGVEFTHSWRGRTGFTFDYLPNVGQRDGIWHAMGYSGSGNAMAPYLGHKAALQMLGDPEGETAFSHSPFAPRFWHHGYPWFLPFADIMFRIRDIRANARRAK